MHMQQLLVGNFLLQLHLCIHTHTQSFSLHLVEQTIKGVVSHEQFAYLAAVSCAERGLKSHLLLRGEQPEILTGYNLISTIYGNVTYVPRSLYANREKMLQTHANHLVSSNSGHVAWFNDIFESSFTTQTSSSFVQMDANRSAENSPRKVAILNEGAGDAAALLGKCCGFSYKGSIVFVFACVHISMSF